MKQQYTIIEPSNIKNKAQEVRKIKNNYEQLLINLTSSIDLSQNYWQGILIIYLKKNMKNLRIL